MKTSFKKNLLIAVVLLLSTASMAQNVSRSTIRTNNNGKSVEMTLQDDKLTSLTIDGNKIPSSEWKKYDELVSSTIANVKVDNARAQKDSERAAKDQLAAAKDRENAAADMKNAREDLRSAEQDRVRASADQVRATQDRARAKDDTARAAQDRTHAVKDKERAAVERKMINSIIGDLVSDHIIKDGASLHDLEITETSLIVNTIKQPDAIFKRYKAKYGTKAGRKFNYHFHSETHTN